MHQPHGDDELVELALGAFRNPPQAYYDWVDAMLARRRVDAPPLDHETCIGPPATRLSEAGKRRQ
jgi:hypothetical protein